MRVLPEVHGEAEVKGKFVLVPAEIFEIHGNFSMICISMNLLKTPPVHRSKNIFVPEQTYLPVLPPQTIQCTSYHSKSNREALGSLFPLGTPSLSCRNQSPRGWARMSQNGVMMPCSPCHINLSQAVLWKCTFETLDAPVLSSSAPPSPLK